MRKKNNNQNNNSNKNNKNKKNVNKNQKQNNNRNNNKNNKKKNYNNVNNKNKKKNKNVNNKKVVNKPIEDINTVVEDKFSFVSINDSDEFLINDELVEKEEMDTVVDISSDNDKSVDEEVLDIIDDETDGESNIEVVVEDNNQTIDNDLVESDLIVDNEINLVNEEIKEDNNKFEFVADINEVMDDITEDSQEVEVKSEDLSDDVYNQIVEEDVDYKEVIPDMSEENIPVSSTITEDLTSGKVVTNQKKHKIYLGFEARVVIMLISILLLFLVACAFVFEAITSSGNRVVYYDENSTVEYKVCVEQNKFYTGSCLESDMKYLSDITDTIPTTFYYDVDFSTEIDYDLNYRVVGVVNVVDKEDKNKVLYTTEEVLVQSTELKNISDGIHFQTNVEIPYKKYNQFVTDYVTKYSLVADSYLDVILYLDENSGERAIASVNVPLGINTYSITPKVTTNDNKKVELSTQEWNAYSVSCAVFGVLCILSSLLLVMRLTSLVNKVVNNKSAFQKYLNQILRENDGLIVSAKDGYDIPNNKKKVKVMSFRELVDARNALSKPIVYVKINDVKSEFYVEDVEIVYYYVVKEADFGGK